MMKLVLLALLSFMAFGAFLACKSLFPTSGHIAFVVAGQTFTWACIIVSAVSVFLGFKLLHAK